MMWIFCRVTFGVARLPLLFILLVNVTGSEALRGGTAAGDAKTGEGENGGNGWGEGGGGGDAVVTNSGSTGWGPDTQPCNICLLACPGAPDPPTLSAAGTTDGGTGWGPDTQPCNVCLLICDPDPPGDAGRNASAVRRRSHAPRDGTTLLEGLNVYPAPARFQTFYDPQLAGQLVGAPACQHSTADFKAIVTAVQRLLSFYEANLEQFDRRQDGGVGLSFLKNQLFAILTNKRTTFGPETRAILSRFLSATDKVLPVVFEYSIKAETDPVRVQDLQNLLNKPALLNSPEVWLPYDKVNEHLHEYKSNDNDNDRSTTNIGHERDIIYPTLDFQCLAALADDCAVPTVCRKMYLEEPYSQYMLLHQVLYLQIAKARGCTEKRVAEFGDWAALRDRLCAKAYAEGEFLASHEFPVRFRDLFSEQVAFCGMAGYSNFMRGDWLNEILSWQTKIAEVGCFPDIYGAKRTTDAIVHAEYTDAEGKEQVQDCLMHLSSVSLGALAMNLRYIVDVCPTNLYARAFDV